MKGELGKRLEMIARAAHPDEQEAIVALLTLSATLALARCVEIGGYDMDANVKAVRGELSDAPPVAYLEVPAATIAVHPPILPDAEPKF